MNITYYLGAGASYNACPVLNELSECMLEMAKSYFSHFDQPNLDDNYFDGRNTESKGEGLELMFDIGKFGLMGKTFNTVDTYARKLVLNKDLEELHNLKRALSVFFTLWPIYSNSYLQSKRYRRVVDNRYVSLLATILFDANSLNPLLPEGINFITWNYDFQLELAYKMFCASNRSWRQVDSTLGFFKNVETLKVCHLNGISGFCFIENDELNLIDKTIEYNFLNSVKTLEDVLLNYKEPSFNQTISFAWEKNERTIEIRNRAKSILSNTDVLIIVGYSFPDFNRSIDVELFSSIKENRIKVVYSDPKSSKEVLAKVMPRSLAERSVLNTNVEFFDLNNPFI